MDRLLGVGVALIIIAALWVPSVVIVARPSGRRYDAAYVDKRQWVLRTVLLGPIGWIWWRRRAWPRLNRVVRISGHQ